MPIGVDAKMRAFPFRGVRRTPEEETSQKLIPSLAHQMMFHDGPCFDGEDGEDDQIVLLLEEFGIH
jgi:hypothetical protein